MFNFNDHPPTCELQVFEDKEDVSVFIYDWFSRTHDTQVIKSFTLLRSSAKLYPQEVHLLNYKTGEDSRLMLCTDFQKLACRRHLDLQFFKHGHEYRTCPRCMQRFKGDTLLQNHLEEAACLQHYLSRATCEEEPLTTH